MELKRDERDEVKKTYVLEITIMAADDTAWMLSMDVGRYVVRGGC